VYFVTWTSVVGQWAWPPSGYFWDTFKPRLAVRQICMAISEVSLRYRVIYWCCESWAASHE